METIKDSFFEIVRERMHEVEALILSDLSHHHAHIRAAIEQLILSGGKRIRPTIVLLASRMLEADDERSIAWAAAIEMLHTATLVHDDLIDGAMLRRGLPTLNSRWSTGATVLIGDYVFAKAASLASKTGSTSLMARTSEALMTIVNGEINQMFQSRSDDPRRAYYDRIYAKTASLFEVAAEGCSLLKGSNKEADQALKGFGYNVGIAFQIVDDVLDFIGDPGQVGKPVASDLKQGLITLPSLIYLEQNPDDGRIHDLQDGEKLSEAALADLVRTIRASGAIEQALKDAEGFIRRGTDLLQRFPASPEREALIELSQYVIQRSL